MLLTLALAISVFPQDPTPAARLRELHHEVVAEDAAAAIEKAVSGTPEGALPGISTPALARELRSQGVEALDHVGNVVEVRPQERQVDEALELLRTAWGRRGRAAQVASKPDVEEFERVCSHAFRDVLQVLGSGRDLSKVAPELHGAVDQVRKDLENLDDIDREDIARLKERLARLEKVDHAAVHALAEGIVRTALALDRDELREAMRREPTRSARADGACQGDVLVDRDTGFGRMIVGGFGPNTYDCSQIDVIVDFGGADTYRGPAGGAGDLRRLAVTVDLGGDDTYDAGNDGLGSATFGIGVLVDVGGSDTYAALSRSAGFGLGGVGVLVDTAGDDRYTLGDLSGGVGFAGSGLFVDLAGDDVQVAGVQSLGCGLPGGVGMLVDLLGDDARRLGSERKLVATAKDADTSGTTDRDAETLQQVSIGLGAGVGALPHMSGGLGICFDRRGNDRYEAGGLACGIGVRGGVGVFREAAGDDRYTVGDVALGAAYASGFAIMRDEAGADAYVAGHFALGSASGGGVALSFDGSGDDTYTAMAPAFGSAQRAALGAMIDLEGKDGYMLRDGAGIWRVRAVGGGEGAAIGVFLHLGGAEDEYSFAGSRTPENGRTRVVDGGAKDAAERHFLVDR